MAVSSGGTGRPLLVAVSLAVLTASVYAAVRGHDFIVLDDNLYVGENAWVLSGLTWPGALWAFTTFSASNWHPLTWVSHMADVSLFGMNAGAHHLVNVFFHLLNTVVLFLALRRMTGSVWRSAFAAALFGVHPLHVESVAWIAERKDLLSGLFFFLGLWSYARYAERPGVGRYLWVALFFVLGLLSKPMVVTFPFVLLLLDYWPLGRFSGRLSCAVPLPGRARPGTVSSLVLEKAPLFLLSAASCAVTYLAQGEGGAMGTIDAFPLWSRLSNAAVSYVLYLWKAVWPSGLAMFYQHPASVGGGWTGWQAFGSVAALTGATWFALRFARRCPYVAVGWLWYLGTLVPVIGLVQVGLQAMADRYTYLPLTGVFLAAAWGIPEALPALPIREGGGREGSRRLRGCALGIAGAGLLAVLSLLSWRQAGYWSGNDILFRRQVEIGPDNWMAHNLLAVSLLRNAGVGNPLESGAASSGRGGFSEALQHARRSVDLKPDFEDSRFNLALMYEIDGSFAQALREYDELLRMAPGNQEARIRRDMALHRLNRTAESEDTKSIPVGRGKGR